jgi:hypothetical protein
MADVMEKVNIKEDERINENKIKKIDERINKLKEDYENAEIIFPTEIYKRITGYFQPLFNWNLGKKSENKDRKVFVLNKALSKIESGKVKNSL